MGEGDSIGLLAPEPEPATDVLSDVVASDGWTLEVLLAVALACVGDLVFEGGMRVGGRVGGRVSPACANVISFIA